MDEYGTATVDGHVSIIILRPASFKSRGELFKIAAMRVWDRGFIFLVLDVYYFFFIMHVSYTRESPCFYMFSWQIDM